MIRPATPADLGDILRLVKELAEFEREPDAVKSNEAMLHEAFFGERPAAESLVAELDGAIVGIAVFYHSFSTWTGKRGLWLDDLYVTPAARTQGVGRALLKHLAQIAVDRDCGRYEWWVLDWNTRAVDFYRAMGAEAMDEWTVQRVSGNALLKLAERD